MPCPSILIAGGGGNQCLPLVGMGGEGGALREKGEKWQQQQSGDLGGMGVGGPQKGRRGEKQWPGRNSHATKSAAEAAPWQDVHTWPSFLLSPTLGNPNITAPPAQQPWPGPCYFVPASPSSQQPCKEAMLGRQRDVVLRYYCVFWHLHLSPSDELVSGKPLILPCLEVSYLVSSLLVYCFSNFTLYLEVRESFGSHFDN